MLILMVQAHTPHILAPRGAPGAHRESFPPFKGQTLQTYARIVLQAHTLLPQEQARALHVSQASLYILASK